MRTRPPRGQGLPRAVSEARRIGYAEGLRAAAERVRRVADREEKLLASTQPTADRMRDIAARLEQEARDARETC